MFELFPIIIRSRITIRITSLQSPPLPSSMTRWLSFQASFKMTKSVRQRAGEVRLSGADDLDGLMVFQFVI